MTASATNDSTSPAPTTEGETLAVADVGAAVKEGEEMNLGAAAVDEHGEVEPEEDPDEQAEDDEGAEVDEVEGEAADGKEAALMEPLVVLKPGEEDAPEEPDGEKENLDEEHEKDEPEELEGENEELEEEPEEAEASEEEPEKVEGGKEECNGVEDKGLVDGSAANDMHEVSKEEHGKCGNTTKDNSDSVRSKRDDVQNSELAGGLEIFVDGLPKDCAEEDIAMVFSQYGEVKSVRIIKNSSTEKSKDIAFVCYASIEAAKKALIEFKEGLEVKGEKVRVSACQDNNTLYLGNICKGWTKDQVLTTLKSIGIQECKITFPTYYKGGCRGFAFLKFASHYYARAAFRRLMKSDAIFGTDRSAKVSFYQTPIKQSENVTEAKNVYLEHVPLSWDEDKIKDLCQQYGKILKVDLFQISKNMESETFCFVEFSSSKGALACVEGINNTKIVDGGLMLSACLARPKSGLKVNSGAASEGATTSKKEKGHTGKVDVDTDSPHKLPKGNKNNLTSWTKEVLAKTISPSKLSNDYDIITTQGAAEVLQTSKPSEGKRNVGKNRDASVHQKSSKKAWNNCNADESQQTYQGAAEQKSNSSKRKRKSRRNKSIHINERPLKKAHDNSNVDRSLRSKAYASDLEPHAGFIPPTSRAHSTHAYDQRRTAEYDTHPTDRHPYARETVASQSVYSGYTSHAGYEAGYTYVYPPPPPPSGSYYRGNGLYIPRRGDY